MDAILEIQNLSIGYSSKKQNLVIANKITVKIDQPKFIALIGKNGIGKSTLLRTIAKVQPRLFGEIFVNTKNLSDLNPSELSKMISVVLTERIPSSNLTVYELIALGRQVYTNWIGTLTKEDKKCISNAINQVKINAISHKKIDELSDGQYQKVMIARALAQDTSIILLDEPTAHLDIVNKVEVFKLLRELVAFQQKTIIVSSHELQLAIQFTDDLWLLLEDDFVAGCKKELINKGFLQKMFSSNMLSFNKETHQFIFN